MNHMDVRTVFLACCVLIGTAPSVCADVLLQNVQVYDGSGRGPFPADVRVSGKHIVAVAPRLRPMHQDLVIDEHGLALAPGFIDMHSHGDDGLLEDLDAGAVARQGVTTILVGQDGESHFPLADWFGKLKATPPAINVASMVGHATVRTQVMGKDLFRTSTPAELERMKPVLAHELAAGAFGLSTGLEYEQAHFATTDEVVELSKVAAARGGFYISHVRDEANGVFDSYDELLQIGREAHLPVEITHIKLGSVPVWHQAAARMPAYFERARREHIDLRADVYPYTYWESTIRVIVPDRDFYNSAKVAKALEENGGAEAIRLTRYTPEPAMAGHTLAEIAGTWNATPVEAYMRIVRETIAEATSDVEMEGIIGTSMSEDDLRWFIAQPEITFCSDGALHDPHPRGAGAFPRVLGRYVRDEKIIPIADAVRRLTGLPATNLGLDHRGFIQEGMFADVVLFDPATIADRATFENPHQYAVGVKHVFVNGVQVLKDGEHTGAKPGRVLWGPGRVR
jgi:N-acyl-D-amino-acid deacylase